MHRRAVSQFESGPIGANLGLTRMSPSIRPFRGLLGADGLHNFPTSPSNPRSERIEGLAESESFGIPVQHGRSFHQLTLQTETLPIADTLQLGGQRQRQQAQFVCY